MKHEVHPGVQYLLESQMDEKQKFLLYNDNDATLDASSRRRMAVEVALDLIRHEAMSGSSRNALDSNLRHLSDYADFIQEALRGVEQEDLRGSEREDLRGREKETSRGRERETSRGREH
jgi:trans-2-enoyl-CoA reductase